MQEDKTKMDRGATDEADRRRTKAEQDRKDREFQDELNRREMDRKRMKEENDRKDREAREAAAAEEERMYFGHRHPTSGSCDKGWSQSLFNLQVTTANLMFL
jgi:hypothetical protein